MNQGYVSFASIFLCLVGCSSSQATIQQITSPAPYRIWLQQANNQKQIMEYKQFLVKQHVQFPAPDFQMLRSAREWQKCHYSEFNVPTPQLWKNAVPTLKVMNQLSSQGIIPKNIEVTSSYRALALNRCAGGAKTSSHLKNSAIDFRIGATHPTLLDQVIIYRTKTKLCKFWRTQGQQYNMGLGIYPTGQIHVDTNGYRTWGYNHKQQSSLCTRK